MNPDDAIEPYEPTGFDSRDCLNVIVEAAGDDAIRPCPPELVKYLAAEREKIRRVQGGDSANGV